jgi:hypothetical protein
VIAGVQHPSEVRFCRMPTSPILSDILLCCPCVLCECVVCCGQISKLLIKLCVHIMFLLVKYCSTNWMSC